MIEIKVVAKSNEEKKINLNEKKSFSRKDVMEAIAGVIADDLCDGYADDIVADAFTIFGCKIVRRLFDESEE